MRSKFRVVFDSNDFFARRVSGAHRLRERAGQRAQLRQHLELVEQALRRLDIHQARNAVRNLIDPVHAKRQRHAPLAAELVDETLWPGWPFDVLKQQRRSAGRVFVIRALTLPARRATPFLTRGR